MALTNVTGEYLKIVSFNYDVKDENHQCTYLIFANAEQRAKYESGLGEYEQAKWGHYNGRLLHTNFNGNPNSRKSMKDNFITACYNALKNDMFKEWTDA